MGIVLHVDADAFFCQVEVARRRSRDKGAGGGNGSSSSSSSSSSRGCGVLKYTQVGATTIRAAPQRDPGGDGDHDHSGRCDTAGRGRPLTCDSAICVQQHQDIIAVSHAARALGAYKHMPPKQARRLLLPQGGHVLHVFTEPRSGRVSYRPYRRASRAIMSVLRDQVSAQDILQVASIDEAYVQWHGESFTKGLALAKHLQQACFDKTGYRVSIGVAPNMLLAKLASSKAKPFGIECVRTTHESQSLLVSTAAWQLPGLRPKRTVLQKEGIQCIQDLQSMDRRRLASLLGLSSEDAGRVFEWCRGRDTRTVQAQGPPKTYGTHSSLTPVSRPEFNAQGNPTGKMLNPVTLQQKDVLMSFFQDMALELLERIQEFPSQIPTQLTLHCRRHEHEGELARSMPFPSSVSLAQVHGPDALERNADRLARACWPLLQQTVKEPTQVITRVSLVVSNMRPRPEGRQLSHYFAPQRRRAQQLPASSSTGGRPPTTKRAKRGPSVEGESDNRSSGKRGPVVSAYQAGEEDAAMVHTCEAAPVEFTMHEQTAESRQHGSNGGDSDNDDDSPFSDEHWKFEDALLAERVLPPCAAAALVGISQEEATAGAVHDNSSSPARQS